MRILLSDKDRSYLFTMIKKKGYSLPQLAIYLNVSRRTLADWRRGKYTISYEHYEKLLHVAEIGSNKVKPKRLENWWHTREAGRKGASAWADKYGSLGTPEGRRLGGRNSYILRKDVEGDIFKRNAIFAPPRSKFLSEFIGAMIGDGNMTNYQVSIYLSSLVDEEYGLHIVRLAKELFGIKPTMKKIEGINCLRILISSIELVEFLKQSGVLKGNKIRQNLDVPGWILEDQEYAIACLRGMFDTDGSIFQECHKVKEKLYCYPRWSLVSASPYLRESIKEILNDLDFCPKIRNNRSVNLESLIDISRYFGVIGSSNPKHLRRWAQFGEVA